jgi:hypothetical protein
MVQAALIWEGLPVKPLTGSLTVRRIVRRHPFLGSPKPPRRPTFSHTGSPLALAERFWISRPDLDPQAEAAKAYAHTSDLSYCRVRPNGEMCDDRYRTSQRTTG